jgi:hypothetical protein
VLFIRQRIGRGLRQDPGSDRDQSGACHRPLYEAFLAGCAAKADELDDSSGSLGQFAHDLICSWIEARQASGADPDQRVATLLAWMDDDPYAFCEIVHLRDRPESASTKPR